MKWNTNCDVFPVLSLMSLSMKSDVTVVKELGMQGAKCPSPFPSFSANIPSCCLPQSKFPPEISFYWSTSSLGKAKQQKAY